MERVWIASHLVMFCIEELYDKRMIVWVIVKQSHQRNTRLFNQLHKIIHIKFLASHKKIQLVICAESSDSCSPSKRHNKLNYTWKSTTSSSNGLNNLTVGPEIDNSPRGRSLASKTWPNSKSERNLSATVVKLSNFSPENSGNTPTY